MMQQTQHPAIDPITIEVIRGQFRALCEEMQLTLIRSSFSAIIRDIGDTTAVLLDRNGKVLAQSIGIPVHLGVLVACGRVVGETFPEGEARPGDIYAMNDPYQGGTHLPDIAVIQPVFDGETLLGYAASMSHHHDVGGTKPGSVPFDSFDLAAEGFRIPLMRIGSDGELHESFRTLIMANTRSPESLRGDLQGQLAACGTGTRRLMTLANRWGSDLLFAAGDALMDQAELITRAAIEELPDGTFVAEDYVDDDGFTDEPLVIRVSVTVDGDHLHFDFTGTSPQARSAINNTPSSTACAVYYAVQALTRGAAPNNDGCLRMVTTHFPLGTLVNPMYPAPCGARAIVLGRIASAVFRAMALCAPDVFPADADGQSNLMTVAYTNPETQASSVGLMGGPYRGGVGASRHVDGQDVTDSTLCNGYWIPVEESERDLPVRINHLRLWTDSGGAGRRRGGLGSDIEYEWLGSDATLFLRRDRHKFGPEGTQGGLGAPYCRTAIEQPNGETEQLPGKAQARLQTGAKLRVWTTGGGGFGPPTDREVELVFADVLDGRVSREAAHDYYGVVITACGNLDEAATQERRRTMSNPTATFSESQEAR